MTLPPISVCILAKDAEATLERTLISVASFPEVILLDNGSSDRTVEIARKFLNVKVLHSPFIGFGPLRNLAAHLASHDWILALDSDEELSPLPYRELDPEVAYALPRHNYFNGKRIRGCGWREEWVARLYHRRHARFGDEQVHEALVAGKTSPLPCPIRHTPFRSAADFIAKMQLYSTLFAQQNAGQRSSYAKALGHASFAFFRSYVLRGGFLDGWEGLAISLYNGNTTFYKYVKLSEG